MKAINGNKIVKFIYSTGCIQIEGKTREKATIAFENWINNNTPYRGLNMYAKHKGYYLIFEDEFGNRYMQDGTQIYRIDEYMNLIERVK